MSGLAYWRGDRYRPAKPSNIYPIDGGYLILEDREPSTLARVDHDFYLLGSSQIKGRSLAAGVTLTAIHDWTPAGDGIIAFADVEAPGDDPDASVFVYLTDRGDPRTLMTLGMDHPSRNHYLYAKPSLAALEAEAYILLRDESASLWRLPFVTWEPKEVEHFPEEFSDVPRFGDLPVKGLPKAKEIHRRYEQSRTTMGVYAWDGFLYLLTKDIMSSGYETDWWLIKLDPRAELTEVSRALLPTQASHLAVVPGAFWAFIERGPVDTFDELNVPSMNTDTVKLVAAERLDGSRQTSGNDSGTHRCLQLAGDGFGFEPESPDGHRE